MVTEAEVVGAASKPSTPSANKSGTHAMASGGVPTTKVPLIRLILSLSPKNPEVTLQRLRLGEQLKGGLGNAREVANLVSAALAKPLGKKIKFSYDDVGIVSKPASPPPKFKYVGISTNPEAAGPSMPATAIGPSMPAAAIGPSMSVSAIPASAIEARIFALEALMNHKFEVVLLQWKQIGKI